MKAADIDPVGTIRQVFGTLSKRLVRRLVTKAPRRLGCYATATAYPASPKDSKRACSMEVTSPPTFGKISIWGLGCPSVTAVVIVASIADRRYNVYARRVQLLCVTFISSSSSSPSPSIGNTASDSSSQKATASTSTTQRSHPKPDRVERF